MSKDQEHLISVKARLSCWTMYRVQLPGKWQGFSLIAACFLASDDCSITPDEMAQLFAPPPSAAVFQPAPKVTSEWMQLWQRTEGENTLILLVRTNPTEYLWEIKETVNFLCPLCSKNVSFTPVWRVTFVKGADPTDALPQKLSGVCSCLSRVDVTPLTHKSFYVVI